MQPSTVEELIEIPGSISTNTDICAMSGVELDAFSNATLSTIQSIACPKFDSACVAELTSVCGLENPRRSLLSQSLQNSNWQLSYIVRVIFTCQVVGCSSPSDKDRVSAIASDVSKSMAESISDGGFLTLLGTNIIHLNLSAFDHKFFNCLIVWGIVGEAKTEVSAQGTGVFYPDWDSNSGTCLEDGNEPDYMKSSKSVWLLGSLMECCLRYFPGWNFNKCINPKGSGLWYVKHMEGKCVTDCEEGNGGTCGGLANPTSDDLYDDPKICCESQLPYLFTEFCEASSLQSSCYMGTGLYYRGDSLGIEVCVRDCDPSSGDSTCGGLIKETYMMLYDTAIACCNAEYSWIDVDLCTARSTNTATKRYWPDRTNAKCVDDTEVPTSDLSVPFFDTILECCKSSLGIFWLSEKACLDASGVDVILTEGFNKFYIDWVIAKCVQDCEGSAPCGGFAQKWEILYDSELDCCAGIPWVPVEQCVSK